jgi:DNA invertase Pin-like site-specific DNA recombinase
VVYAGEEAICSRLKIHVCSPIDSGFVVYYTAYSIGKGNKEQTEQMKKAAIYARVSTADQNIDSQLYALRELATQRGFEVVHEYQDRGVSGRRARRQALDAMMSDARRKKFSVVLVWAFDRIARSTRNFLQIIDELDSLEVEFISRRENISTGGPMGRLFVTLISSIAELESDLIRERVKMGMHRAALDGVRIGRAPMNIDRAAIVRDRLNGMTLTAVSRKWAISRSLVCKLVKRRAVVTKAPCCRIRKSLIWCSQFCWRELVTNLCIRDPLAARDSHPEIIMQTEFRFRLNGEIMPEIFIQQKTVAGEPTGEREIAVNVDGLGWFTIDDNGNLWDAALPQFVLEYRDETSWALIPLEVSCTMKDKGWNRVTPQELIAILESAGAIRVQYE